MLNFNPALRDRNPVLRESSFQYVFQKSYLSIELALKSEISKLSGMSDFLNALEIGCYNFLDDAQGNLIPVLLNRHGIHQVSEAIILCITETETRLSQNIKAVIEEHYAIK